MIHFNLPALKSELETLENQATAPDFWDDMENSGKVLRKTKALKEKISNYESLCTEREDLLLLIDMANEENDADMAEEIISGCNKLSESYESMRLETLLTGP